MNVLIDTNIVLDVLMKREPHFDASATVLQLCQTEITGNIAAYQVRDLVFLLKKAGHSRESVLETIKSILNVLGLVSAEPSDVRFALDAPIKDFEDALLASVAQTHQLKYIVTRNTKDFKHAQVVAIEPQEFVTLIKQVFKK